MAAFRRRYAPLEAPPSSTRVIAEERRSLQRAINSFGEDLEQLHSELEARIDEETAALSQEIDERVGLIEQMIAGLGQTIYDTAHPIGSILILAQDTAPVVPEGVTATWEAISSGRVLLSVDSGAGEEGGSATVETSEEGAHDHGGLTGAAGAHNHTFSGQTELHTPSLQPKFVSSQSGYNLAQEHRHSFSGTTSSVEDHEHTIAPVGDHSHTVDISDPPHFKVRMWRRIA